MLSVLSIPLFPRAVSISNNLLSSAWRDLKLANNPASASQDAPTQRPPPRVQPIHLSTGQNHDACNHLQRYALLAVIINSTTIPYPGHAWHQAVPLRVQASRPGQSYLLHPASAPLGWAAVPSSPRSGGPTWCRPGHQLSPAAPPPLNLTKTLTASSLGLLARLHLTFGCSRAIAN